MTAEERPQYELKKSLDEATASRKFGELSPDPGREYTEASKAAKPTVETLGEAAKLTRESAKPTMDQLSADAADIREAAKPTMDALRSGASSVRGTLRGAVDSAKKSIATGVKDFDRNLGRALASRSPEQIAEDEAIVNAGKESEAKRQRDAAQAAIDSNKVSPAVKAQRAANEASRRSGSGQNRKKK